jgi:hypothetical protein
MEQVLDHVIQSNTAQLADAAFVKELKSWIRFNGADAVRARDGLYSASSGNPNIPSWFGDLAFRWLLTAKGENDKYARQVRSSAGIAVFVGLIADKANGAQVGRCCQRFALQATALGIRNAFLNLAVSHDEQARRGGGCGGIADLGRAADRHGSHRAQRQRLHHRGHRRQ